MQEITEQKVEFERDCAWIKPETLLEKMLLDLFTLESQLTRTEQEISSLKEEIRKKRQEIKAKVRDKQTRFVTEVRPREK